MATSDLVRRRLHNQRLVASTLERPADVVAGLGAVQAQDYRGALWGIGLRTKGATEAQVERAIAERAIVRSWPMRGTLHFVPAADLRWMVRLLTPRVLARAAGRYRELGLDDATFVRSGALCEAALRGDRQLTRDAMYRALEAGGVSAAGQRGIHILGNLAMRGLLCFGPHEGRQPTFALLDEWLPATPPVARDEALDRLARRYFASHGPATLHDFAWWSGLALADAKAGLASARAALAEHDVDGRAHWSAPGPAEARKGRPPVAHLLPAYDEFTVAYKDRGAILDPPHAEAAKNGCGSPVLTVDGRIVGVWAREAQRAQVRLALRPLAPLSREARRAVTPAAERYGRFVGLAVSLDD